MCVVFCCFVFFYSQLQSNSLAHYLWIWYFREILQARDFREEFLYHVIMICRLFLQQVLCEACV